MNLNFGVNISDLNYYYDLFWLIYYLENQRIEN